VTNPFEAHGLDHLSPSSLNLWATEPAFWAMNKLLGHKFPPGVSAIRGTAVEQGINIGLQRPTYGFAHKDICVRTAETIFDNSVLEYAFDGEDYSTAAERERKRISGYVYNGFEVLSQYGKPSGVQDRVEINLDDVPVPVIGYTDWRFDDLGVIVDLKTTDRLPSSIRTSHARQGAVYAKAYDNYAMVFVYVKSAARKKDGCASVSLELSSGEKRCHLESLRQIALRLGRFLALSKDRNELVGLLVPDYESFYWNSALAKTAGKEVYGF